MLQYLDIDQARAVSAICLLNSPFVSLTHHDLFPHIQRLMSSIWLHSSTKAEQRVAATPRAGACHFAYLMTSSPSQSRLVDSNALVRTPRSRRVSFIRRLILDLHARMHSLMAPKSLRVSSRHDNVYIAGCVGPKQQPPVRVFLSIQTMQ